MSDFDDLTSAMVTRAFWFADAKAKEELSVSPAALVTRANNGSVDDGRLILAFAIEVLRSRPPSVNATAGTTLPCWLAEYLADRFETCLSGSDAARSLNIKRSRGGSKFAGRKTESGDTAKKDRNAEVARIARVFQYFSAKNYLARTAKFLSVSKVPAPKKVAGSSEKGEFEWTSRNVRDCLDAHDEIVRLNQGI